MCGTWFEKFGIESKVRKPVLNDFELYRCQLIFDNTPITLCHPSAMMRKSMLDKFNIRYDETYLTSQDYRLWNICSRFGRMAIIEEVLLMYRTHEKQISTSSIADQINCANEISSKQLSDIGVAHRKEFVRWRRSLVISADDYIEYYNWLESVKSANDKIKLYRQESMEEYIRIMQYKGIKRLGKKKVLRALVKANSHQRRFIIKSLFNNPQK